MADRNQVNGDHASNDVNHITSNLAAIDLNDINGNYTSDDLNHVNGNAASNDNDQAGWYLYPESTSSTSSPLNPVEESDDVDFDRPANSQPTNFIPGTHPLHPIIPDDLMTNDANQHANFLDFPAIEVPSAEEHAVRYFGVVKSVGPWEEKTAVVRTIDGCDVECSTEGCQGLHRLRPMELCQIAHYTSGEREGMTFVTHAAAECTPMPSGAVSRVPSLAGSRRGSVAQSRAQSPAPG